MSTTSNTKLRLNNPYHFGVISIFLDGEQSLDREKLVIPSSPLDKFYIIRSNDEMTTIAYKFYGDSKYWWIIADRNDIENPFILEEGKTLIIPDLNIATLSIP